MDPDKQSEQAKKLEAAILRAKAARREVDMKPLKTYQTDVADAIKKDNVSVIKMALAEKKRQEAQGLTPEAQSSDKKRSALFISLSVVLILAGLSLIGYFYFSRSHSPAFVVNTSQNLIHAEKNTELKLERADPQLLVADVNKLKAAKRSPSTIENLVITEKDVGPNAVELGARHIISGGRLISLLNTEIPGGLFRSLLNPYMLGIYQNGENPEIFVILKTDSYDSAFAGMLEWEKDLGRDITPFFSLPPTSGTFTDRLIDNRDTRILLDNQGNLVFLYSFLDPNTIVFAQSEASFKEIIDRYLRASEVRK
jgi:hypothetical protein